MLKSKTIYTVLFILFCFAVYNIARIETSGEIYPVHESGDYYSLKKKADDTFKNVTYIRIFFEKKQGETNFHYFQEMENYVEQLERLYWTGRVLSPTRVQDLKTSSMEFASETIYKSDNSSAERLAGLLTDDSLFGKFFLSHDRRGSYLYVFYPEGSWKHKYFQDLEKCNKAYSDREILPLGMEILEEHIAQFGMNELIRLGIIALIVIFTVEIIIFRSLLYGFLFSIISFIPSIYAMSLLPILGISFTVFLIPVPILTLVLSTTYTLHIVSYITDKPEILIKNNLIRVFPVVSAAAATTLFGFLTMLLSPLEQMKYLGILMSAGVLLSFLVAWYAIPPLIPGYMRKISTSRKKLKLKISSYVAFGLLIIVAAGIPGILSFENHRFILKRTVRKSTFREYIDSSSGITGATHQFTVLVDTGKEYGLVAPRRYNNLMEAQKKVTELPYTVDILSISNLTNWINGKIEGMDEPVVPKDEMEIGESLELLFSTESGLHPESLINQDYSAMEIQILIDARGSGSWKSDLGVEETRDEIEAIFRDYFPDSEIVVLSDAIQIMDVYNVTRKGILTSVILFYPIVFLFLLLLYRSFLSAFISILPSIFSAVIYLGLMGYFNFYFSGIASISICMLIGVSIDDSVVLVQFYLKHSDQYSDMQSALQASLNEVGRVIIKTTLIIVLGTSVLLLSAYREVVQNSFLLILAFVLATLLTLFFIPAVLSNIKKERIYVKK